MQNQEKTIQAILSQCGSTLHIENNMHYQGITTDSRLVKPGWIFLALTGENYQGFFFIDEAIEKGAIAILTVPHADYLQPMKKKMCWIYPVPDLDDKAGLLLHHAWDQVSNKMKVIGITGTNGKTSSSFFLAQILHYLSQSVGLIGTLGAGVYPKLTSTHNTTPSLETIHCLLYQWFHLNVQWTVLEVTSHALSQSRVSGVQFDAAVWTNLSQDHLDYHQTINAYFQAKLKLFKKPSLKVAVINLDDAYAPVILKNIAKNVTVYTYSMSQHQADLYVSFFHQNKDHILADIMTPWGCMKIKAPILGRFNVSNLLGIIGVLGYYQIPLSAIESAIHYIQPVSGRMCYVQSPKMPQVIIDFAHTPDALKQVLIAIRSENKKSIICIFGCGGNRDRAKRSVMMREALLGAERVIFTENNSRDEAFLQIVQDALENLTPEQSLRVQVIKNRCLAIQQTIMNANIQDIILIAGKGHEQYQIKSGQQIPFNEISIVKDAFSMRKKIKKSLSIS
ncbi:MAG: UDP-N-acetylmuramoyl-L-alanyl-D-glutamate--2,6-diaminopimelate ligase [Endozoicomonadaceae bacterium]|nr:UDP-N-acetylmuramoyl-L-alanyl-D-glutamate--2,6-diaminopimelate ligase [Endozoicomonadaceae bacterium]